MANMSHGNSLAQIPVEAARLLADNPQALAGIHASAQYAWVFARSTLIAWPYEQGSLSQVDPMTTPPPPPPCGHTHPFPSACPPAELCDLYGGRFQTEMHQLRGTSFAGVATPSAIPDVWATLC